jgi:hypothetical protein
MNTTIRLICCLAVLASLPAPAATEKMTPEELKLRTEWSHSMAQVPLPPRQGCFAASYPAREWKGATCVKAPNIPMPPRVGPRALVVGNGSDISAQAPSGFISQGTGSFDAVTGVTSLSSPIGNAGAAVNNAYTLQLNTNFFSSTACAGAANPAACQGWEQYVFFNDGSNGVIFIQYWLLNFDTTCPATWNQFQFTGSTTIYCYRNANNAAAVPNQPVGNLAQLVLTGNAAAGADSVALGTPGGAFAATGDNSVNATAGWTIAEFNVFGAGGSSAGGGQVSFNAGASVVPRTRVIYGGTSAPNCVAFGFTGETNNLNFGPNPPAATPAGPAVMFTESIAGGALTACAAASSIGDTHLATFHGLFYDFQASGDFVLAEVPQEFVVHARQVSGAPNWPNASVNKAVAARIGKTHVAVCLAPDRVNVDGKLVTLADGKAMLTRDGTTVRRVGNAYLFVGETGHTVRAEMNGSYINVSVGLGHWPAKVRGLVANANGNVNQVEARDGTVLSTPFQFEELYHRFGDSWRVRADESLLKPCAGDAPRTNPGKPFYARDLDAKLAARTRKVCMAAGVKEGPLLEACALDVAVIGNDKAARVFVKEREPRAFGEVVLRRKGERQ